MSGVSELVALSSEDLTFCPGYPAHQGHVPHSALFVFVLFSALNLALPGPTANPTQGKKLPLTL